MRTNPSRVASRHRAPPGGWMIGFAAASRACESNAAFPAMATAAPVTPRARRKARSWSAERVSSLGVSSPAAEADADDADGSSAGRLAARSSPDGGWRPNPAEGSDVGRLPLASSAAGFGFAAGGFAAAKGTTPWVARAAPTAGAGGRAPGPLDAPLALAPDARRPASSSLLRLSVSARMRMLVLSVVMYWCAGGAELWSHTYRRKTHDDASWLSTAGRWREGDEGERGGSEGMGELCDDKGSSPRHLRMNPPEDGRFSSASMLGALWRVHAREPRKFEFIQGGCQPS